MSFSEEVPSCEHCGTQMKKWKFPTTDLGWDGDFHYVCFNDDCGYYVRGWTWMMEKYQVKSSYRNRLNPVDGKCGPLPVWSSDALKDNIIE